MPHVRSLLPLLSALLCALSMASAAAAQEGEPVVDVVFIGDVGVDHGLLASNLATRTGKPYRAADVDADTRWLASTYGILAVVRVESGPRVVFDLARVHRFDKVLFFGNDDIRTSELFGVARLREDSDAVLDDVKRAQGLVAEHYLGKGYAFVQVEMRFDADQRTASLWIFEGPKVDVEAAVIEGLTVLRSEDVLAVLSVTPGWFAWILGKPFVRSQLDRDVVTLESFVRGEGYLDARVSLSRLEFSEDRETVVVHLFVDEGDRYRVRSMDVSGNSVFTAEQLLADSRLQPGGWYRRPDAVRLMRGMYELYGGEGYIDAEVRPEETFDDAAPELHVTWKVSEGRQKRVRDVIVRGNVGTRDQVVRRSLTLYPGDIVDTGEMEYSEDALVATGYFTDLSGVPRVRVGYEETPDPELVDVTVDVGDEESGLFAFQVGAGSDSGIFGGVSVDKRNFDIRRSASSWGAFLEEFFGEGSAYHGGGQRLSLDVIPGTETTQVDILFEDPWLDPAEENPWGLIVNLYDRRRYFDDYDRDNSGVFAGVTHRLSREQSIRLGVRTEGIEISDVDTSPTTSVPAIAAAEGDTTKLGLEGRWAFERLDSRSEPTEGRTHSFNVEWVPGGDITKQELVHTSEFYMPVGETDSGGTVVLHPRVALGIVGGDGDLSPVTVGGVPVPGSPDSDDLPFFEKLFVGGQSGPFAMRGFDYRGVGPHQDDEAIGGELAMVASAELLYPLMSRYNPFRDRDETTVKGVIFVDVGNLLPDTSFGDLFSDMRAAAGVGVRLRLPALGGVTFALDFAPLVLDQDDDQTRSVNFELSRRF